ncbi:MAG: hypothetical protein ACOYI8_10370 [Christensenellales bacterium]|jgi:hypothetical protein
MKEETKRIIQTILLAIGVVVVPYTLAKLALWLIQAVRAGR